MLGSLRHAGTAAGALTSWADSGEPAVRELTYALHVQLATVAARRNRSADATHHTTPLSPPRPLPVQQTPRTLTCEYYAE